MNEFPIHIKKSPGYFIGAEMKSGAAIPLLCTPLIFSVLDHSGFPSHGLSPAFSPSAHARSDLVLRAVLTITRVLDRW
jgi:hypothetical protein